MKMENNSKESEEEMQELLDKIEPNLADFISRRIHHVPFAKVVVWLSIMSKRQDFVYTTELSHFTKTSTSNAHNILRDFCKAGILFRKPVGSLVEYHFKRNGNNPIINHYLDRAKKTLDLL